MLICIMANLRFFIILYPSIYKTSIIPFKRELIDSFSLQIIGSSWALNEVFTKDISLKFFPNFSIIST